VIRRFSICFLVFILVLVMWSVSACHSGRNPSSDELPPVQPSGVPSAVEDETPVIKTDSGYTLAPIPGVDAPPAPPVVYKTFSGASN
jgi:hypothetical protein